MTKELADSFIKERLLHYFKLNCNGRANAKTKDFLLPELDKCYGFALKERELRSVLAELPEIGSHNSIGYFFIADMEDLKLSQAELRSRVISMSERLNAQGDSFIERMGKQGQLL